MSKFRVPLQHPTPDSDHFINVLLGKETAQRPPLIDYLPDDIVLKTILTDLLDRTWVYPYRVEAVIKKANTKDEKELGAYWDNYISFWYRMGYDYVRLEMGFDFPLDLRVTEDTATLSAGQRAWREESKGVIQNWDDFERYPWLELKDVDFFPFEYVSGHLPDGMKMIVSHAGGPFEWLSWILSLEGLSLLLYDAPDLVDAVMTRLGELMGAFYAHVLEIPHVCAVLPGDDMGFKTATMISPAQLQQYILPWHKRFAQMCHDRGIPYFLHSCGNVEAIMEDLIEDVKIDGKHSFEDAIIPAAVFHHKYGHRIATLGGVDMDYISRHSPDQVRTYVRRLIDECMPVGRFAVGTGNSIANYIPLENYLTLVDEALK